MTYRPAPITGCAIVTLALLTALAVGLWVCTADQPRDWTIPVVILLTFYLIAWVFS